LFGSGLFAQNAWETLPVFHGGRVMPLHSFARQMVREICGTTRPFIIRDDTASAEFNQTMSALQRESERRDEAARQETLRQQIFYETENTSTESAEFKYVVPDDGLSSGGFSRPYSIFGNTDATQSDSVMPALQDLQPEQVERLADRIHQLVPTEGRYFSSDELLLLWITEPEVWTYIPIFPVPETDYLDEIFDVSLTGDARTSQYRVSLHQLNKSQRYQQRCAEMRRRSELGQVTSNPVLFDQITERLEHQSQTFQDLTFHPQRQRPTRMLSMIHQIAGMTGENSAYMSAFNVWERLLTLGDIPEWQITDRSYHTNDLVLYHPTTKRWHAIADQLHFLMQIYERTDSAGNPTFPKAILVEQQCEILIDLIDANLAESAALMEAIYPGISYPSERSTHAVNVQQWLPKLLSPITLQQNMNEIRQNAMSYHYTVRKLRSDVEAAYLALYDNGRSLRFLPLYSPRVLEMTISQDNFGVQPWASAQMILGSGETFIKRFFDPQFEIVAAGLPAIDDLTGVHDLMEEPLDPFEKDNPDVDAPSQTLVGEENGKTGIIKDSSTGDAQTNLTRQELLKLLFMPSEMRGGILQMKHDDRRIMGTIRSRLRTLQMSFASLVGESPTAGMGNLGADLRSSSGKYGNVDFRRRAQDFAEGVNTAALQIENLRRSCLDEDSRKMVELFTKTAYPENMSKLRAEYWYDRLHPFYWMGIFALLAVLLNSGAYIFAATRDKSIAATTIAVRSSVHGGKEEETTLPDNTNSIEEWLFLVSVVMLTFAVMIAFFGAAMRAGISGWAPVTNMYETVVMMAFATAVLGVWYALYPLLHPALEMSWDYSRFPRIRALLEWIAAVKAHKAHKSIPRPDETDGEAEMREMAKEFGVPDGMTFGRHQVPTNKQTTVAEIEARQRVNATQRKLTAQCLWALPRLLLTFGVLYVIVLIANGEYLADHGVMPALTNMFATTDTIDTLAVIASVFLIAWLVPHILLTLLLTPLMLFRPSWIAAELGIHSFEMKTILGSAVQQVSKQQEVRRPHSEMSGVFSGEKQRPNVLAESRDTSGGAWLKQARNAVLDRKLFIAITGGIVFVTCLIASWNRAEFNPDIRPIAAVLRSNFWLAIHVTAIIVSYAAAFAAWGMAVVSLGYTIFGRYQHTEAEFEGQKKQVQLPAACQLYSTVIERLIKIALLLLIVGTVLGARWADYSWGRFWSWDPKEVWALITILFYAIVIHGKAARYYGQIGVTVGALFASIAVIITWYGINFVFKGSIHAYGGGTASNAALFLAAFITVNILWGALALLRYNAEVYGNETDESPVQS